jgi:hypothetical protein
MHTYIHTHTHTHTHTYREQKQRVQALFEAKHSHIHPQDLHTYPIPRKSDAPNSREKDTFPREKHGIPAKAQKKGLIHQSAGKDDPTKIIQSESESNNTALNTSSPLAPKSHQSSAKPSLNATQIQSEHMHMHVSWNENTHRQAHIITQRHDVEADLTALMDEEHSETAKLLDKLSREKKMALKFFEAGLREELEIASKRRVRVFEEKFDQKQSLLKRKEMLQVSLAKRYVCMYVCIYVCMYVCMYVCTKRMLQVSLAKGMCVCVYVCVCLYVRAGMYVCMFACVYVCMCMYVCTKRDAAG